MCQLGDESEGVFYLYLISKVDLDFSACNNSPTVLEDGYSIYENPKYGPDVGERCYIDPGGYMANALGIVYSSANPLDRQNALEFCSNASGYKLDRLWSSAELFETGSAGCVHLSPIGSNPADSGSAAKGRTR